MYKEVYFQNGLSHCMPLQNNGGGGRVEGGNEREGGRRGGGIGEGKEGCTGRGGGSNLG